MYECVRGERDIKEGVCVRGCVCERVLCVCSRLKEGSHERSVVGSVH